MDRIISIDKYYGSLPNMLSKFEKRTRQDAFKGETILQWKAWREASVETLKSLIGIDKMEACSLNPDIVEVAQYYSRESNYSN